MMTSGFSTDSFGNAKWSRQAISHYDHSMKMAELLAKYATNTKPSRF